LNDSDDGVVINVNNNLDMIHRLRPKQQNFLEDRFVSIFAWKVIREKLFCWAHWKQICPQCHVYYEG